MWRKLKRSNRRKRRKSGAITSTRILTGLFLLILFVFGYAVLTFWIFQETINIRVSDKRTEYTTYLECTGFDPESGVCMRSKPITTTYYIVITPNEKFETSSDLYDKIEIGERHKVLVTGWSQSIFPRRITEISDLTFQ